MRIALLDVDGHNYHPNLALMKLSAYHKRIKGDTWYKLIGGEFVEQPATDV